LQFNIYYLVWIFFVSIQTSLFFSYWLKAREQQKKWDKEFKKQKEAGFDIVEFVLYNNMAYWMENNSMIRAKCKDRKVFCSTKEIINPFELKDIDVSEYFEIMTKLEKR
jgi:hypothetical protein